MQLWWAEETSLWNIQNIKYSKPLLWLADLFTCELSSRGLHGLKTEARTRPVPEIVWPDPTRAAQLNLEPEPDPTRNPPPPPQRIAN